MASINITITRDNGTSVSGSGTVDDSLLIDITSMLGALLFDAVITPAVTPPPTP
jgi:hypothetical protein